MGNGASAKNSVSSQNISSFGKSRKVTKKSSQSFFKNTWNNDYCIQLVLSEVSHYETKRTKVEKFKNNQGIRFTMRSIKGSNTRLFEEKILTEGSRLNSLRNSIEMKSDRSKKIGSEESINLENLSQKNNHDQLNTSIANEFDLVKESFLINPINCDNYQYSDDALEETINFLSEFKKNPLCVSLRHSFIQYTESYLEEEKPLEEKQWTNPCCFNEYEDCQPNLSNPIEDQILFEEKDDLDAKIMYGTKKILYENGISAICKKGNISLLPNNDDCFIYADKCSIYLALSSGSGPFGHKIGSYCIGQLSKRFLESVDHMINPKNHFKKIFLETSEKLKNLPHHSIVQFDTVLSGCSIIAAYIQKGKIYIGHVGDCKVAILRKTKEGKVSIFSLTSDHKPSNLSERKRIYSQGGEIRKDYIERVFVKGRSYPGIQATRTMGNDIAQLIGCHDVPEIVEYNYQLDGSDHLLILANNEILDFIEDEEVKNVLSLTTKRTVKMATDFIINKIKSLWIQNNMTFSDITIIILKL